MAGLNVSNKPVLRGKQLPLPTADRPFFFVGQPLEVQNTLRTHLLDAPSGQAQLFLNIKSQVACCSTLVHHEGQHLWQLATDENIARNHLEEAYLSSVKHTVNPVLHGNAALGVVYGSECAVGLGGPIV